MSSNIEDSLREWIDEIVEQNNYSEENKNFLIQFSVFCLMENVKIPRWQLNIPIPDECARNVEIDTEEWYLQCAINGTCEEGLYDINVKFDDTLDVEVDSHKCNYESFIFDSIGDTDYNMTQYIDFINASDLYPDFKPSLYRGSVCTRGGFTGWNYKYIPKQ